MGLAGVAIRVAVALVETPSVGVLAINVDLKELAAALATEPLGGPQERCANPASALTRDDVEFIQQPDWAVVPDVRSHGQQRNSDRRRASQHSHHVPTEQEPLEPGGQNERSRASRC